MSTRLVVNADDLGLHPDIDEGILRANRDGIVTSATVLVQGPNAAEAVKRALRQDLGLGVHLCLSTRMIPAADPSEVPSLLEGGRFRKSWVDVAKAFATGKVRLSEVETELRAQVKRLVALGAEPDHLDAHQHLHLLPGVATIVARIAREQRLPVRWPREVPRREWTRRPGPALKSLLLGALAFSPEWRGVKRVPAIGIFEAGALDEETLLGLIASLRHGEVELGCHPGAKTVQVPEDPEWTYGWTAELDALCSPKVREALDERGIELCTYRELATGAR